MPDAICALGRIDPLQLAWAAGFFDGEGSTIVHESHPGYLRLTVSVPQWGGDDPPEVLFRFQAAMFGLGLIEQHNNEGMWRWRSRSGEEAQLAIGLMWSELGSVKRAQAASAIRRFHGQYRSSRLSFRPSRLRRRGPRAHTRTSADPPSRDQLDHAWAAGFLDGEGTFGLIHSMKRKNAPDWYRIRVCAPQKGTPECIPEVLQRMSRILGGTTERHGDPDDRRWIVTGITGVERVLEAVRPMLGTVKQTQAAIAIERFKSQQRLHGDASRCARGHAYSSVYVGQTGPKQRCNACARIRSRMKRAAKGIKARRFKNVARRYNF